MGSLVMKLGRAAEKAEAVVGEVGRQFLC